MPNLLRIAPLVGLVSLLACAAADPTGSSEQPIIHGATTTSFTAVGIVYFDTGYVCSGFLVAPNVVVTAAHCFDQKRKPIAFYTGDGAAVSKPTDVPNIKTLVKHDVITSGRHPNAVTSPSTWTGTYPWKYDVAFVVLKDPIADKPLPYGTVPASGAKCTLVGYGLDGTTSSSGTGGVRRAGTATMSVKTTSAGYHHLTTAGAALASHGDSGGPVVCNGIAAGVFSALDTSPSDVVVSDLWVGTDGPIKTWIDGVVTTYAIPNPPADAGASDAELDAAPPAFDAGNGLSPDAAAVDSGLRKPETPAPPPSSESCSAAGGSPADGRLSLGALVVLALATLRRRRLGATPP